MLLIVQLLPVTVTVSVMVVVPSVRVMVSHWPSAIPVVVPVMTTLSSSLASRLPSGVPFQSRGAWMATVGAFTSRASGRLASALLPKVSVALAVRPRVLPRV